MKQLELFLFFERNRVAASSREPVGTSSCHPLMRRGIPSVYSRAIAFGLASAMYGTTARLLASNDPDLLLPTCFLAFGGATAAIGLMATFVPRLPLLRGRWTRSMGIWSRPLPLRELTSRRRLRSPGRPTTKPLSF